MEQVRRRSRDGNLSLTALASGRVPLINATKRQRFALAQVVLTLAWASGRVLISNPANNQYGFSSLHQLVQCHINRAENNSQSSDNGWPNFANVWRNRNLGRTFCPANFLLQHLTISFTNKIWLSYTLLFRMYLCVYVRPNFPFVRPKWCPSRTYVLSRQKNYLQPCDPKINQEL